MNLVHQVEKPVNARKPVSVIQLELLKLHHPPKRKRRWLWRVIEILKLFSVRGSATLYREIGPGYRPERVERKEGRPRFY